MGTAATHYPWEALDMLSRAAVERAGSLRRRLGAAVRLQAVAQALGEALAAEAAVVVQRMELLDSPPALPEARVDLVFGHAAVRVVVALEPALAGAALARLLDRPVRVEPLGAPLEPALAGALAALVVEVARRAGGTEPPRLATRAIGSGDGLWLETTVVLDGRPYWAGAWACGASLPTAAREPRVELAALGELPISVPVVAAVSQTARAELESLQRGDAYMCGPPDPQGAALCAPGSERGIPVEILADGDLLVRDGTEHLPLEVSMINDSLEDAVLDAPIVVRIELGAVSLSAREWARLGPGDVILAARRIAEPAILRVAGREVARGELVNVDGELGVRIQQIDTGRTEA